MSKYIILVGLAFVLVVQLKAGTLLVGHRGGDIANVPENTMEAIVDSFSKGVAGHEIDVRETSDGNLLLMHDSKVDRTTNATGNFSSFTTSELRAMDAGSWKGASFAGEQIPFFSDVLSAVHGNGSRLYIDAPFIAYPSTFNSALTASGFNLSKVTFLTRYDSQSTRFVNAYTDSEVFRSYHGRAYDAATMPAEFSNLAALGVDGLTIKQSQYSTEYIQAIHDAGLKVAVVGYGSSSEAQTEGYISDGVDELWYDDVVNNVSSFNDGNGILSVPEPSSMCFVISGLMGIFVRRRL